MKTAIACISVAAFAFAAAPAQTPRKSAPKAAAKAPAPSALRIYFADVEGGQATLFVAPDGESLLIDTGNPGPRDTGRILGLAHAAGIAKIDDLVVTHYHTDHVGGLPELAAGIPIGRFIDHGVNREDDSAQGGATVKAWTAYQAVLAQGHAQHLVVKPGDTLPLKAIRAQVVSADGELLASPLPSAGQPNPACDASPLKPAEDSENDRSVGLLITFGRLRILDLGDLTWARERDLVCPANKLGQVDVYIVSHHGLDRSGSPALVDAIAPRVAIMDNGPRKGGAATTFQTIEGSSRLKDLWQLHTAEGSDAAHNAPESRIANLPGPDTANALTLTGREDGSFSVTNNRTGQSVDYPAP
jgi:beta-lactamase superfamily II metal-dependent hydrolase